MIKYGCVALAIACGLAAPAAQAQGNFFIAGQTGHATYHGSLFDQDSGNTRGISGGYRWQAGKVTQVGFEIGAGEVDDEKDRSYIVDLSFGTTRVNYSAFGHYAL